MNNLEIISHEIMVFMRGKYRLDEIIWGILPYVLYQYERFFCTKSVYKTVDGCVIGVYYEREKGYK